MSDKLGPLTYGRKQRQVFLGRDIVDDRDYSETIADAIDAEIKLIIDGCYVTAKELIQNNLDKLHRVVQVLLEKEVIEGHELDRLLKDNYTNDDNISKDEFVNVAKSEVISDNKTAPKSILPSPPPWAAPRPNLEQGG